MADCEAKQSWELRLSRVLPRIAGPHKTHHFKQMTLLELIIFTEDYRLFLLRAKEKTIIDRRYGVDQECIGNGDWLNLRLLNKLVIANQYNELSGAIILPRWLKETQLTVIINLIRKRLYP